MKNVPAEVTRVFVAEDALSADERPELERRFEVFFRACLGVGSSPAR